jgi:hypothetical protein
MTKEGDIDITGKQFKRKLSSLKNGTSFSKLQLAVFVLAFGLIGWLIFRSFAAAPVVATLEGEQMILPAGSSIVSDSTASAGKAVKLAQNGMATASVNFASSVSSFTLSARGDQCSGAPTMSVAVDGNNLLTNTAVSSTSWASYSYTLGTNIGSGNHSFSVAFTNDYVNAGKQRGNSGKNTGACDRNLYIDITTYYGPAVTNPAPTVSLSASPASVTAGTASTLTWASANASSCTASGAWSGIQPTSGSVSTGALNQNSTYTLTCTGSGGSVSASATVSVITATTNGGSSIYWGGYIEGTQTYNYYYGGSWENSPWDIADTGGATINKFESNAGKKVSIIHYGQPPPWSQAFAPNVASLVTNHGAIPMIDMGSSSDSLATMASGGYDASIKTWATSVKTWGHPFFFRPWWEMNGTWFTWGSQAASSPTSYVNAWRHFHDVVVAQGATNVTWVWCPNIEPASGTSLSTLYPGDSYVDWTCMDGYNQGTSSISFSQVFSQTYKDILAIAPTKPVVIGETSSYEFGGTKASWVTDALTTQLPVNFPKIKALVWFNWRINENGIWKEWPIESSSGTQAAFKSGIASTYYAPASTGIGGLPLLTKVNPLP